MAFDNYDYIMVFVVLAAGFFFVNYYTSFSGNYVSMNTTAYDKYYTKGLNTSICKDLNCTAIAAATKTTVSVPTSSTIQIIVMNSSTTSALRTNSGDILINCGEAPDVMDKLYYYGVGVLNYVYITNLDDAHLGACPRLFAVFPHNRVFDTGGSYNSTAFANYNFILGKDRNIMVSGTRVGNVVINASILDDRSSILKLTFGRTSFSFVGDCMAHRDYLNSSVVFCKDVIPEDVVLLKRPANIVIGSANVTFEEIARKYGVSVYNTGSGKDLLITSDGKSVNVVQR